jgi:hypothetical protein
VIASTLGQAVRATDIEPVAVGGNGVYASGIGRQSAILIPAKLLKLAYICPFEIRDTIDFYSIARCVDGVGQTAGIKCVADPVPESDASFRIEFSDHRLCSEQFS